jgi:hypothetical protein
MPRTRAARADATGVFVWPAPRRSTAATPEPVPQPEMGKSESSQLDLMRFPGEGRWTYCVMDGRREVGRLARIEGGWFWAVRYGPTGWCMATRAAALRVLTAAYEAQRKG